MSNEKKLNIGNIGIVALFWGMTALGVFAMASRPAYRPVYEEAADYDTVDYERLLNAIAMVESDNGKTSRNVYQLTEIWVKDANRISGTVYTLDELVENRAIAEGLICDYWRHYGARYYAEFGEAPSMEQLARMHNGGPRGYTKTATLRYWEKVKKYL